MVAASPLVADEWKSLIQGLVAHGKAPDEWFSLIWGTTRVWNGAVCGALAIALAVAFAATRLAGLGWGAKLIAMWLLVSAAFADAGITRTAWWVTSAIVLATTGAVMIAIGRTVGAGVLQRAPGELAPLPAPAV